MKISLRFVIIFLSTVFLSTAPALAWLFGDDHPDKSEITEWVIKAIPPHFEVDRVSIETQDMRTGFQEYSESRVKVALSLKEDVFQYKSAIDNKIRVYEKMGEAGDDVEIYGLARAVPSGQGWEGEFREDDAFSESLNKGVTFEGMSRFGESVIEGSADHVQAIEAYEEQQRIAEERRIEEERRKEAERLAEEERKRKEAEAAEAARIARAQAVSGVFEGAGVCGTNIYQIEALEIDALASSGVYKWRFLSKGDDEITVTNLDISETRNQGIFQMRGDNLNTSLTIEASDGSVVMRAGSCEYHLHPLDSVPDEITEQRESVSNALNRLKEQTYTVETFQGATPRSATITIKLLTDTGFDYEIDHVRNSNGRFNNSDQNRAKSFGSVEFTDYIGGILIQGDVEGRGSHLFGGYCKTAVTIKDDTITLQNIPTFGCSKSLSIPLQPS